MLRFDLMAILLLVLCVVLIMVSGLYWAAKSRNDSSAPKPKSTEYNPWK